MGSKRGASPSTSELEMAVSEGKDIKKKRVRAGDPEDESSSSSDPESNNLGSQSDSESEKEPGNQTVEDSKNEEDSQTPELIAKKAEGTAEFAELDNETLLILGDEGAEKKKAEFVFHPKLALTWKNVLAEGLKKEKRAELMEKYPNKGNCPILTPKLNLEIEAGIGDAAKKRNKFFVFDQDLCSTGISALGKGISMIFNHTVKEVDTTELLTALVDSGKLMCDLYYQLIKARKAFIYPSLDKKAKSTLEKAETGEYLFGPDLSQKIKSAKAVEKLGLTLKPPTSEKKTFRASAPLNFRVPFGNTRGQRTGNRQGQYQRNQSYNRGHNQYNRSSNQNRVQNNPPSAQSTAPASTKK